MARWAGEQKTCASLAGSIRLPRPTSFSPVPLLCFSPFAVNGISAFPVHCPEIVHSVSPVDQAKNGQVS